MFIDMGSVYYVTPPLPKRIKRWWNGGRCVLGHRFWPGTDHARCRWVFIWNEIERETVHAQVDDTGGLP